MYKWIAQAAAALAGRRSGDGATKQGSSGGHTPRDAAKTYMSYETLLEEREPIDGWMVCTVCLNVDRTTSVLRRRWRCAASA